MKVSFKYVYNISHLMLQVCLGYTNTLILLLWLICSSYQFTFDSENSNNSFAKLLGKSWFTFEYFVLIAIASWTTVTYYLWWRSFDLHFLLWNVLYIQLLNFICVNDPAIPIWIFSDIFQPENMLEICLFLKEILASICLYTLCL